MRAFVGRVHNGSIVQGIKHVLTTDDWVCLFTTYNRNVMQYYKCTTNSISTGYNESSEIGNVRVTSEINYYVINVSKHNWYQLM